MHAFIRHIGHGAGGVVEHIRQWVNRPFETLYRWAVPLSLLAVACFLLPPVVGLVLFLPPAALLMDKAARAIRRIHRLEFVEVIGEERGDRLETGRDQRQRAWVLGCCSLVVAVFSTLVTRVVLLIAPAATVPGSLATYLAFAAALMAGFLLFYYLALRFDVILFRGLASVTVTLPAFFIIVVVVSVLLSWIMRIVQVFGLSAEDMLKDGFNWLYDVQRLLGTATNYFLQQDPLIIGISVVFAALLLLLYTATVPAYWIRSIKSWLKLLAFVALVFSGAAIVFAGAWVVDVQKWATSGQSGQLSGAIDASVLHNQARALSDYKSDDLIALVRAFVLPYTVGVFVANGFLMVRRARVKRRSDDILEGLAQAGDVDAEALPEMRKRYLYYGGDRTLWDIVLRSIGHDIPLPHPFAPRRLTIRERLTGVLGEVDEVEEVEEAEEDGTRA